MQPSTHRRVECVQIIRVARRDEAAVLDDGFIHPLRAGIAQICAHGRPRGHAFAPDQPRFDQQLRTVTYRRDGAVRRGKPAHEVHGRRMDAQMIRRMSPGDHQGIEPSGIGIGDRGVRGDVLPAAFAGERFVFGWAEHRHFVPRFAQGVIRFAELRIFELVSEQNCDFGHLRISFGSTGLVQVACQGRKMGLRSGVWGGPARLGHDDARRW